MRMRDRAITVQGILAAAAVALMLGYAAHTLDLWPPRPVAAQDIQAQQDDVVDSYVFTGVVVKNGPDFVLQAPSNGPVYRLDSPSKAQRFEGKPVRVTGRLRETAKLIQVESIEEAGV